MLLLCAEQINTSLLFFPIIFRGRSAMVAKAEAQYQVY